MIRRPVLWLLTLVALAALALAGWQAARRWSPSRADYPVQGFEADPDGPPLDWPALGGRADFAYLLVTTGMRGASTNYLRAAGQARDAGLSVGAIHRFSLCQPPREQATNLLAHLPRDGADLPLAVELDPTGCPVPPSPRRLVDDLSTFLAVAEASDRRPAILKLSPELAERYRLDRRLDRPLWLERAWREPKATRSWELWLANPARAVPGADEPLRWSVARPDERGA